MRLSSGALRAFINFAPFHSLLNGTLTFKRNLCYLLYSGFVLLREFQQSLLHHICEFWTGTSRLDTIATLDNDF
jgi:hypothetical protein